MWLIKLSKIMTPKTSGLWSLGKWHCHLSTVFWKTGALKLKPLLGSPEASPLKPFLLFGLPKAMLTNSTLSANPHVLLLQKRPSDLYPPSHIDCLNSFGRILGISSFKETYESWSGLGPRLSLEFPIHSRNFSDSLLSTRCYAEL